MGLIRRLSWCSTKSNFIIHATHVNVAGNGILYICSRKSINSAKKIEKTSGYMCFFKFCSFLFEGENKMEM